MYKQYKTVDTFYVVSSYHKYIKLTYIIIIYASDPVNAPYYRELSRTSEHELGLAVDISYNYALHDDIKQWKSIIKQKKKKHAYTHHIKLMSV